MIPRDVLSEPILSNLQGSFDVSDFVSLLVCSTFIYFLFLVILDHTDDSEENSIDFITGSNKPSKSKKSVSWIVMLISSCILGVIGTYYTVQAELYGWTNEFIFNETFFARQGLQLHFI